MNNESNIILSFQIICFLRNKTAARFEEQKKKSKLNSKSIIRSGEGREKGKMELLTINKRDANADEDQGPSVDSDNINERIEARRLRIKKKNDLNKR